MLGKLKKRYINVVRIESPKELVLIAGIEGKENVPIQKMPDTVPIPTKRSYIGAIRKSLKYSSMGICNCILEQ